MSFYSEKKNLYLSRYAWQGSCFEDYSTHVPPEMIIVIPSYKETTLLSTLQSIYACDLPDSTTEVLIIINQPEDESEENEAINLCSYRETLKWSEAHSTERLKFLPVYVRDLPKKYAGVGLARKIGMDEAIKRFGNYENGIIINIDADTTCEPDYLLEIATYFKTNPKSPGCSIYFEHPLDSMAITEYELFLRYYSHGLKYAGFPFYFQTVGSAFAVRASSYLIQGGMNKRKAGEDFYFLHKIFSLGNFGTLTKTTLHPSSRMSDRVPFGTGRAMLEYDEITGFMTYDFSTFMDLKQLFDALPTLFSNQGNVDSLLLSPVLQEYLLLINFENEVKKITMRSSSYPIFSKHFFNWFNGFAIMKYCNWSREHHYTPLPVQQAVMQYRKQINAPLESGSSPGELLKILRDEDNGRG
ncbi:MAG: glycosyltransferase [Cyclobacteriaceae bacterium]|nr:glycosyltransferase [Cyclobacteriaceae bacterium]